MRAGVPFVAVAAAGLCLAATLPACGLGNVLRFQDARTLAGMGIQLRVMPACQERPLPTLHVFPYVLEHDGKTVKVDMRDPRELWVAEQQGAEWADAAGNLLVMATVRVPLPGPFPRAHVLDSEYAEARGPDVAPDDWTPAALAKWVSDFMGIADAQPALLSGAPAKFRACYEFTFGATNARSTCLAYAFRFNPQAAGRAQAPSSWFVAGFMLLPGTDVEQSRQAIRSRFLQYITVAPDTATSAVAPSSRLQSRRSAPDGSQPSPDLTASRREVAQSVANLKDWWYVETDNYILLSNMLPTYRSTVRALQDNVEHLHSFFLDLVPPRVPITAVSVVRIPATSPEYVQYVGAGYAWTAGLWMAPRRELVVRSLAEQGGREQRDQLLRTTYHESFHQYLFYALDQVETAAWFNEGQAAMFESVEFQSRGIAIREDPVKAGILLQLIKARKVSVDGLLKASYDTFYADNDAARVANYTMAWGLVYYLRKGLPADARSPYAGLLDRYVDEAWTMRDGETATARAFDGIDREALDRDFRAFWLSPSRRLAADRARFTREE